MDDMVGVYVGDAAGDDSIEQSQSDTMEYFEHSLAIANEQRKFSVLRS